MLLLAFIAFKETAGSLGALPGGTSAGRDGPQHLPGSGGWILGKSGGREAKEGCLPLRHLYHPAPHAKVHCTS